SDGEAISRAGAVAACGGMVGGTELRATGRAAGRGFLSDALVCFLSDALAGFLSEAFFSEGFLSEAFLSVFLSEAFFSEVFLSELFFSEGLAAGLSEAAAAGLSESVAANTRAAGASTRLTASSIGMIVDSAVERKATARTIGVTAFLAANQ